MLEENAKEKEAKKWKESMHLMQSRLKMLPENATNAIITGNRVSLS